MNVEWSIRARRRFDEVHERIAANAPERANAFCARLIEAAGHLETYPYLGPLLPEDAAFRQLIVDDYRIVYRIGEEAVYVVTIVAPGMLVTPGRLSK